MNVSATFHDHADSSYNEIEVLQLLLLTVLFFVGIFGNLLAIYIFLQKKGEWRRRFDTLLMLLAILDFSSSLFVPSTFIYVVVTHFSEWDFGEIGCKVFLSIGPVNITMSHGILLLIAYERYRSMSNPLGRSLKGQYVVIWLIGTFFVSLLIVSPYTTALEVVKNSDYKTNTCLPSAQKERNVFIFALANLFRDLIASTCIISLCVVTARVINTGTILTTSNVSNGKRNENTKKATKMLIVVACVFSCCVIKA